MGIPFPRLLAASLAVLIAGPAMAADAPVEYALKGTFLYKFLPFVTWPAQAPNAQLSICVLGADPFGPALDQAVGSQSVEGHPVAVRRVDTPEAAQACQVVFVANAPTEPAALQALQGKPILTVTDSGAAAPGIVSFVIDNNHVRFDIDDAAAAKGGLTISSKLLSLARSVKPRSGAL
jgi:uncharacterized protein DUF4154